jgi:DNA-binding LacI/PurR family transcriptional regulator
MIGRPMSESTQSRRPPRRRAAVMADVGRLAGVSHQTVSRVLNNSAQVRPETRERVLLAMRQLDYRPNSVARALVTGRSRTVGVVTFDTVLYGPASTLFGIEKAAHASDYFVSIISLRSLDRASMLSAVDRLEAQGVDGILIIAPHVRTANVVLNLPVRVPVVAVEAGPDDDVPVVDIDQFEGARAATQHLLDLGHRTVWHVAGPDGWLEARGRVEGWVATLRDAGVGVPEAPVGDWSPRSGYEIAERLMTGGEDVTAIFAANDQMALGVLRFLHESGRAVPGEVSVVGFDDIPEAAYLTPSLTTVRQDFGEMGRRSVLALLERIDDVDGPATRISVPPELMVRASTAPCSTDAPARAPRLRGTP